MNQPTDNLPFNTSDLGHQYQFGAKSSGAIPRGLLFLAVVIIMAILGIILFDVVVGGIGTLSWDFVSSPPENGMEEGGIFPAIFGTVFLVILMVIAVVPVGVLTAVYLQEYTDPQSGVTRLLRIAINNLAGVPSIVFGLFGLGFFISFVGGNLDKFLHAGEGPVWGQPAILWASLTMALLTLPVVIVSG